MSALAELNRANRLKINQAALSKLKQAKAEWDRQSLFLVQLGLWGLENLDLYFPITGAQREDVEAFLRLCAEPGKNPMKVTQRLTEADDGNTVVIPAGVLAQDFPEEAAKRVVDWVMLILQAEQES